MESLEYGSTTIEFNLSFMERKTLAIEVHPDASIAVKAPLQTDIREINKRVLKRARWIIRQQKFFEQFLPRTPQREYVSGETHLYLGRKYLLKIRQGLKDEVKLKAGELYITCKSDQSPSHVKKLLSSWYYSHAQHKFEVEFEKALQKFNTYKIERPSLEIRRMKSRWGSCTPSGKIILNPEIIKAPKRCIHYVMIHELCHLVIPNHNKEFYNLLGEIMPEWERWKGRLDKV